MKHPVKFDPIVIIGFWKRMDGLDFAKGPTEFQKSWSNVLECFANFSRNMTNQRWIFGLVAILDLLNLINGLDRDYVTLQCKKQ